MTNYISFSEAKTIVQKYRLKSRLEYIGWLYTDGYHFNEQSPINSGRFLPLDPEKIYASNWRSWKGFLVTSQYSRNEHFGTYERLQFFARQAKIQTKEQYKKWIKPFMEQSGEHFPMNPNLFYWDMWRSWMDFLGVEKRAFIPKKAPSFEEARRILEPLNLVSSEYVKIANKLGLPVTARHVYKDQWQGWSHYLQNNRVKKISTLTSFEKARSIVAEHSIFTSREYTHWLKNEYKGPDRMPANPRHAYADQWQGWSHFFNIHERCTFL